LDGVPIAVWGLTFKAGTDDLRNSPAMEIVRRLLEGGADVRAYDPTISVPPGQASKAIVEFDGHSDIEVHAVPDAYGACDGAAAVVVLTEWDEFRWLEFEKVRDLMTSAVVIDARNLLDPAQLRRIGFEYTGIGRR
jgi:UDPglucose 6-dehydrogenase